MSCLNNLQLSQTVTYTSVPNETDGIVGGQILYEVSNLEGNSVSGEVIVSYVRDETQDIIADGILQTTSLTSSTQLINYDFYYPYTNPESVEISVYVKLRVLDCFYEGTCTHTLVTPNENGEISSCLLEFQGFDVIEGCTNPLYYEYNSSANLDDGSCANLLPVYGCTNPYATNYNKNATFNDGSCVFPSGCTNTLAANYDQTAIIDDGTCECGDINIELDFGLPTGESYVISDNCDYTISFDMIPRIECEKLINYLSKEEDTTPLGLLNELKVYIETYALTENGNFVEYTGGTIDLTGETDYVEVQNELLYEFDINNIPTGLGLLDVSGSCDLLLDLIAIELGLECQTLDENLFKEQWLNFTTVLNSDLSKYFLKYKLRFANFNYGLDVLIDNLKFDEVCTTNFQKCELIPSVYGFELEKVIDNKKSWVNSTDKVVRLANQNQVDETDYLSYDSRLIFNTKYLELRFNPLNYIEKDTVDYFNNFTNIFSEIDERLVNIDLDKVKNEFIDVTNRQTIRRYGLLETTYERYLDGEECAESKALNYYDQIKAIELSGDLWYKLVKQFVPTTTIWDEEKYVIKNNIYHFQKHKYQKYTLGASPEIDAPLFSGVTIECNKINDQCFNEPYSDIDDILTFDFGNVQCVSTTTGDTIGYGGAGNDGQFKGRLVQYSEDDNGFASILNYYGFDDLVCVTAETLSVDVSYICGSDCWELGDDGCWEFADGFVWLFNTEISEGEALLNVNINGGVPPYTVIGNQNEEVMTVGSLYSVQVRDSRGVETSINTGTIVCPFPTGDTCSSVTITPNLNYKCILNDCNFNTGQATLNLSATGGQAPYRFLNVNTGTEVYTGDIVSDGALLNIQVWDDNNCSSEIETFVISCPQSICTDIGNQITLRTQIQTTTTLGQNATFELDYDIFGIVSPNNLASIQYDITTTDGIVTAGGTYLSNTDTGSGHIFSVNYAPSSVGNTTFNISAIITLTNGCVFNLDFDMLVAAKTFGSAEEYIPLACNEDYVGYEPPACEDIQFSHTMSAILPRLNTSKLASNYNVSGLPAGVTVNQITFNITPDVGSLSTSTYILTNNVGVFNVDVDYSPDPSQLTRFTVVLTVELTNGCIYNETYSLEVEASVLNDSATYTNTLTEA